MARLLIGGRWVLVLCAIGFRGAWGTERYVPSQYPTMQAAIDASVAGDTIWVAPGSYSSPSNKNLDFHGKNLSLKCQGPPGACVIDCQHEGRAFYFHSGEGPAARVVGFAITNGCPIYGYEGEGGGVWIRNSSPTFLNCIIWNNFGESGGGVSVQWSNATLANCVIADNWSFWGGGGIDGMGTGTPVIRNCTVVDNRSQDDPGGAYFHSGCAAMLTNTIFRDNTGGYNGTQIGAWSANVTVSYSNVHNGWTGPGQGNIDADALFVDRAHRNYHLRVGSPCIDSGDPNFVPPSGDSDIDGEPRRMDGDGDGVLGVDMGADEHHNDCNQNGVPDNQDIANGTSQDCNGNGVPDECEIAGVPNPDCNQNGTFDICDIASGVSQDCDGNGVPDECQDTSADCNGNGIWDVCDVFSGLSLDFNSNGRPDECETVLHVPSADFPTLQSAVNAALPGATVLVAPGVYTGPGNRDVDFGRATVSLLCDAGPGESCVIDCQSSGRAFWIRGFSNSNGYLTRIVSFTILNGLADEDGGGGILIDDCSPTIQNCTIRNCSSSTNGGGVASLAVGDPVFIDCTITDNTAAQKGGGIYVETGEALILQCTISNNHAGTSGGGAALSNQYGALRNSIVWGNAAPTDLQLHIEGHEPEVTYSDVQGGWDGEGNRNQDPLFVNPAIHDYHVQPESPVINSGRAFFVPAIGETDVDRQPRINGGRVDMGADEYYPGDCNGNGVPDWQDIANGTSQDCTGNMLPDECEPDCNGNGIPDSCDIGAATSADRNANGIPDECEAQVLLYVDDDGPGDPAPGDPNVSDPLEDGSLAHPFDAIQEALDAAGSGFESLVEVVVLDGTYQGPGNRDIDTGGRCLLIHSANGPATCVIDCAADSQNPGRGFNFHSGEPRTTLVQGFSIRNGWIHGYPGGGAGIQCDRSSPTIRDCIITDNTLFEGSGVGVFYRRGSVAAIEYCTIARNTLSAVPPYAWHGGGIGLYDSRLRVLNCAITNNTAAIHYSGGAGLSVGRGLLDVYNSVIADNVAYDAGGGLGSYESATRIYNSTITRNRAIPGSGGGISCTGGTIGVRNSILWGDEAAAGEEIYYDGIFSGLVRVAHSDVQGGLPFGVGDDSGNIDVDPLLVAPAAENYHLAAGSPCIDSGTSGYVSALGESDLDGQPRILDGDGDGSARIDMGADERYPAVAGDLNCDGVVTSDDIAPFVLALSDPAGYADVYPGCHVQNADCNNDGDVDFDDINAFVELLSW